MASTFNQGQIRDLIVPDVSAAASVAAGGGKVIYVKSLNAWFGAGSGKTVDNVNFLNGSGTQWHRVGAASLPAEEYSTSQAVYKKGAIAAWKGRYIECTADTSAAATIPANANWKLLFTPSTFNYSAWADVEAAKDEVIMVAGSLYIATDFIDKSATDTVKRTTKVTALTASVEVQAYTTDGTYAKGQRVTYSTLPYIVSKALAKAPASPSLKADGSGDLEFDWSRLPSNKAIKATDGQLATAATSTTYISPEQYGGVTTGTVYRYYIGTIATEFTDIADTLSNLKIMSANFHVETFLGETRSGTKAYDEFISHNNDSDESRVRVISEDGTKLQIQIGTNIKVVGG